MITNCSLITEEHATTQAAPGFPNDYMVTGQVDLHVRKVAGRYYV